MSGIVCVCVCVWKSLPSILQTCLSGDGLPAICNCVIWRAKLSATKKGREKILEMCCPEKIIQKKNWIKNRFYTHIQNILIFSNVTPHSNTSLHALQFFFKWHPLPSTATFCNRVSFPASQIKKKHKHGPPLNSCLNSTLQSACEPSLCRSTAKPLASYSTTTSQRSVRRISTFEWGSVSSSWLELEGEGVADLLPGGEGEPWGSALRLTWGFSWVSALMGLGSIEGELFIRGWLRAGS